MSQVTHACNIIQDDVYIPLERFLANAFVTLKLEGFNIGGSIKMKTALALITALEESGDLKPGKRVIESSSGNLGVALSIVCNAKGYPFICVTDPNISQHNKQLIEAYGGRMLAVTKKDSNGGYLQTRIQTTKKCLKQDPSLVWTNQYANDACKEAHKIWTAPSILRAHPSVRYLFIGVGTAGTLMGCIEYMREHAPHVQIIAVDSDGSISFGTPPKKRHIPGLGASRKPKLLDRSLVDDIVIVPEKETISMCRRILKQWGILVGGSTGTVLAGLSKYADKIKPETEIVAISPDFGERYLNTIYNDDWVTQKFPDYFSFKPSTFPQKSKYPHSLQPREAAGDFMRPSSLKQPIWRPMI